MEAIRGREEYTCAFQDEETHRTGNGYLLSGCMSEVTSQSGSRVQSDQPAHRYNAEMANQIEAQWQNVWEQAGTYTAPNPGEPGFDPSKKKKFVLDMFPYPSGVGLHVGHPLGYIATDIYARYLRMTGHNVLHAMGFDSFGLPAEQYAIQTGQHPRITTEANIANMKVQLRRLGLGHEARRGVSTTDPQFYRWTQWIFLQLYNAWYDSSAKGGVGKARPISELIAGLKSGTIPTASGKAYSQMTAQEQREEVDGRRLAYRANVPVNWCPMLGTVLANEEVTKDGRSERGNFPVYKRGLMQWMMRITTYADRLADDLETLDWPVAIKLLQRNWIGRSRGAKVLFKVEGRGESLEVFTTRPDTLFGATYMVLSPEHPMVASLVVEGGTQAFKEGVYAGFASGDSRQKRVNQYREYAKSKTEEERAEGKVKTGVFTGSYSVNPVNGAKVPIFIADYVMMGYGTGAIMAVPAHDDRDYEFAKALDLPIVEVVKPVEGASVSHGECFTDDGIAMNSAGAGISLNGLSTADAKTKIIGFLEANGSGKAHTTFKLRDWLFSRQRYWGEPFPIVYDSDGVTHPLPESMLPLLLPELTNFQPESSEDPQAPVRTPLSRVGDWVKVRLDLGNGVKEYTRETNTMPNWAGSCWYYLRYLDPENTKAFCDARTESYWMKGTQDEARAGGGGVDLYVGGVEHAVLHLLYARFWHKVLFDLGAVSTVEPFQKLFNQGYIQAFAFKDARGMYVEASKVALKDGALAMENQDKEGPFFYAGEEVTREYGKMGKSLKNAVSPDEVCAVYGCDTLRVYEMSMGPLEASKPWNIRDISGAFRFLQRTWRNLIDEQTGQSKVVDGVADRDTQRLLHKTILAVRRDYETMGFNTAVSKLIELNNALGSKSVTMDVARPLILMLSPLAPHLADELWHRVVKSGQGSQTSIAHEAFPAGDASLAADDEVEIPISVMGRPKHRIKVAPGLDAKGLEAAALADPKVQELLAGKVLKKMVVVPGKMVNLVLE